MLVMAGAFDDVRNEVKIITNNAVLAEIKAGNVVQDNIEVGIIMYARVQVVGVVHATMG